jgi:hypothetical protein
LALLNIDDSFQERVKEFSKFQKEKRLKMKESKIRDIQQSYEADNNPNEKEESGEESSKGEDVLRKYDGISVTEEDDIETRRLMGRRTVKEICTEMEELKGDKELSAF